MVRGGRQGGALANAHLGATVIAARRSGLTLAETVVALVTTGIIVASAGGVFVTVMRAAAVATDGAEVLDAVATTALLLPAETRTLMATDVRATAADSFALRAFRGTAIVCGRGSTGPIVRYAGLRDPDPAKDSVLLATASPERTAALISASPHGPLCVAPPGESLFELVTVPDSLRTGDIILVFESGAYHLSTGAFRYRPAGGTRQPLTADVFRTDSSAFAMLTRSTMSGREPLALIASIDARSRVAAARRAAGQRHVAGSFFLQLAAPLDSLETA